MIELTGENIAITAFGISILTSVFYASRKIGNIESAISNLSVTQKSHGEELAKNTKVTTDLNVSLVQVSTVLMGTPLAPNGIRGDVAALKEEMQQVRELKHEVRNLLCRETLKE